MRAARFVLAALLAAPAIIVGKPCGWLAQICRDWTNFCLTYVAGVVVPEIRSLKFGGGGGGVGGAPVKPLGRKGRR